MKKLICAVCLLVCLSLSAAMAETVSFDGSVKSAGGISVTAPIGGTAGEVAYLAGQKINSGDAIVTLQPSSVKATRSGTVTGVFAAAGDDLSLVTERYGAVLYLDPDEHFTISTTTDKAYDSAENKYIRVGENVYLQGVNYTGHTGSGIVTSVSGTSYTVTVTEGDDFYPGENVRIFRLSTFVSTSRIGTGSISRVNPVAITGDGSLFELKVSDGDHVEAGDELFTWLPGVFDAQYNTGNTVTSPVSGIIESIQVAENASVNKGDTLMKVCTPDSLYIELSVNESDLPYISEGDEVEIEFLWNEGTVELTRGKIRFISYLGNETQDGTSYTVQVAFTPDDQTRLGMTAVVYTLEE